MKNLQKLKKKEFLKKCEKAGLSSSGTKVDLIERLQANNQDKCFDTAN